MACGIAWFSLASLLLPAALSAPVCRSMPTYDTCAPNVCCCMMFVCRGFCLHTGGAHRPDGDSGAAGPGVRGLG